MKVGFRKSNTLREFTSSLLRHSTEWRQQTGEKFRSKRGNHLKVVCELIKSVHVCVSVVADGVRRKVGEHWKRLQRTSSKNNLTDELFTFCKLSTRKHAGEKQTLHKSKSNKLQLCTPVNLYEILLPLAVIKLIDFRFQLKFFSAFPRGRHYWRHSVYLMVFHYLKLFFQSLVERIRECDWKAT